MPSGQLHISVTTIQDTQIVITGDSALWTFFLISQAVFTGLTPQQASTLIKSSTSSRISMRVEALSRATQPL